MIDGGLNLATLAVVSLDLVAITVCHRNGMEGKNAASYSGLGNSAHQELC